MSPNQKKEGHSGASNFYRQAKTELLRVFPPMSRSRRSSRASSPVPTSENAQTALLGSSQSAQSALSLTSAPKSITVATASEPINLGLESWFPAETEDIREKTRQLVEQRLGLKFADLQALPDPKVLVEDVRKDLKKHHTDNPRHGSVGRILKRVDKYLQIVDVAVQHHPDVRNPLWLEKLLT